MDKFSLNKESWIKDKLVWFFQLIASVSWMVSVFAYGLNESADYLQLLASSAWTVSNIINYFRNSD
jgi:hypothetical protein|tara:strand:- start:311 stop:508 length:198 start_codon:yes stop_codon:yes gene_type:complete